jgi:hypothetical protein
MEPRSPRFSCGADGLAANLPGSKGQLRSSPRRSGRAFRTRLAIGRTISAVQVFTQLEYLVRPFCRMLCCLSTVRSGHYRHRLNRRCSKQVVPVRPTDGGNARHVRFRIKTVIDWWAAVAIDPEWKSASVPSQRNARPPTPSPTCSISLGRHSFVKNGSSGL